MAKARITTADGAEVNIEGTPAELSAVLKELKIKPQPAGSAPGASERTKQGRASGKVTVPGLLDGLIEEQFFKKPKGIGDVRRRLGELGHHYPTTSLSGPLQGHARRRLLRRFKEQGKYIYAQ